MVHSGVFQDMLHKSAILLQASGVSCLLEHMTMVGCRVTSDIVVTLVPPNTPSVTYLLLYVSDGMSRTYLIFQSNKVLYR